MTRPDVRTYSQEDAVEDVELGSVSVMVMVWVFLPRK